MKVNAWLFGMLVCANMASTSAQTTLSGDHIITGDVNVGTSGAKGNLEVTGATGGSASPGIKVTGDGGVLFEGTHGTGHIPVEGDGTRFMWYPKKSALRVGQTGWNSWDDGNIGEFSMAFGYFSSAVGNYSTAFGNFSYAIGVGSTAIGDHAYASGWGSTAMGETCGASGPYSTAMGFLTSAIGLASTAMGADASASGYISTAFGHSTTAMGDFSTASGDSTYSAAYCSFVIGRGNVGGGNPDEWEEGDPLFEIGNGTGYWEDVPEVRNRNAFTVYKNGDVKMTGKIRMPRQGDILMGEFGDPE